MANRPTLTRTDQVMKALRKGGRIEATGDGGLLRLMDRKGNELPAWQTALNVARKRSAGAGEYGRCLACGRGTDKPCGGLDGNGLGCTNRARPTVAEVDGG